MKDEATDESLQLVPRALNLPSLFVDSLSLMTTIRYIGWILTEKATERYLSEQTDCERDIEN